MPKHYIANFEAILKFEAIFRFWKEHFVGAYVELVAPEDDGPNDGPEDDGPHDGPEDDGPNGDYQ
jgi:hypothetical protein